MLTTVTGHSASTLDFSFPVSYIILLFGEFPTHYIQLKIFTYSRMRFTRDWSRLLLSILYVKSLIVHVDILISSPWMKLAILNAGGAFGRVLPNFFADKFGTYNMLLLSLYASSVLVFVILAIHTPAGMTCFAWLYGFWSGSCMFFFDLVAIFSTPI